VTAVAVAEQGGRTGLPGRTFVDLEVAPRCDLFRTSRAADAAEFACPLSGWMRERRRPVQLPPLISPEEMFW